MAAIEKVCEFSGEYPGYHMYKYKKNLIQVMPTYRKLFRGAEATLYVKKKDLKVVSRSGLVGDYDKEGMKDYIPEFTSESEYKAYLRHQRRAVIVPEYEYCLVVKDKGLFGEVEGEYYNYTYHLPTVVRKMKRLLKAKKLDMVTVHSNKECLHQDMDFIKEENK